MRSDRYPYSRFDNRRDNVPARPAPAPPPASWLVLLVFTAIFALSVGLLFADAA